MLSKDRESDPEAERDKRMSPIEDTVEMVNLPGMVLSEHDVQTAVDFEIPQSPVVLKLTPLPLTSSCP